MLTKILWVIGLSAIPFFEQRLAIPVGIIAWDMNPFLVFFISLLGSILPVPFVFFFFNAIFAWIKKVKWLGWLSRFIENKIRKNAAKFEKYEEIALIIFVGIPLPTTGLWTGTAIAAFLGLNFKKSLFCSAVGGVISAILITVACVLFKGIFFPNGISLPAFLTM